MQNPIEDITAPEDAMQIDLVPGSLPSGGDESIVTTCDHHGRVFLLFICIPDIKS